MIDTGTDHYFVKNSMIDINKYSTTHKTQPCYTVRKRSFWFLFLNIFYFFSFVVVCSMRLVAADGACIPRVSCIFPFFHRTCVKMLLLSCYFFLITQYHQGVSVVLAELDTKVRRFYSLYRIFAHAPPTHT